MSELSRQHCRPMHGQAAMTAQQVADLLPQVAGWQVVDGALERHFGFQDFQHTMAFVNAVAWIAQREDHGPDLFVNWTTCRVRFNTHDVNGLSLNDFICAAKVDALTA